MDFFPKDWQRGFTLPVIVNSIKEDLSPGWNVEPSFFISPIPVRVFSDARETRSNYQTFKEGQKIKTSNAAITEAAYQVALATKAIWAEETDHSLIKGSQNPTLQLEYQVQYIVPCIVTTAKLYCCDFNPNDVDSERGEIPLDKATLQEKKFVIYEYSLPKHLQSPPKNLYQAISSKNLEIFVRMDIVVVNSVYFKELLVDQISLDNLRHLI